MLLITRFHKKCRIAYLRVALIAIGLSALFLPSIEPIKSVGDNIYTIYVNGIEMGKVDTVVEADTIMNEARRNIAGAVSSLMLIDYDYQVVGEEVRYGTVNDHDELVAKVEAELKKGVKETMQHSYTVKIDEYMVNVSTAQEVVELLETSIHRFDTDCLYSVNLISDEGREVPVLVPEITKNTEEEVIDDGRMFASDYLENSGFYSAMSDALKGDGAVTDTSFSDYEYGLSNISFANTIEVVESYLPSNQVSSIEDAINEVTKDKEEKTIYEVVSGDTLSKIANKTGISMDEIVALNDSLTSTSSTIRVGEELIITVPKPELSVEREELVYYEGTYEADIIYQYNTSWYTTSQVTLQDPSSGYHKAVKKITYLNNEIVSTEVLYEEIIAEAVPKIVEKGTKIPPTYIRPVTGGRITSKFGSRNSVIKGMSTNHKGVDIGVPLGTSVYASCGGTVKFAGWSGSYGNVVFINHPDGRQTRYAHLSKILVKVGDKVSQGQKIALSGSTGVSTGPHVHFEIRINGTPVNPLKYISSK